MKGEVSCLPRATCDITTLAANVSTSFGNGNGVLITLSREFEDLKFGSWIIVYRASLKGTLKRVVETSGLLGCNCSVFQWVGF